MTSLHDGMNLVAKEFVAARDDEHGVLILSRFTGACHELTDALMVNPYDTGRTRRLHPPRPGDGAARAPGAHAPHAGGGAREEYLSMGRPT